MSSIKCDQANPFKRVGEAIAIAFGGLVVAPPSCQARLTTSGLPTHTQNGAPTAADTAPTRVEALKRRRTAPVDIKGIIEDLSARFNPACRPDEDAVAFLFGLAVGRATMIDL
jgi:hypothetical protein